MSQTSKGLSLHSLAAGAALGLAAGLTTVLMDRRTGYAKEGAPTNATLRITSPTAMPAATWRDVLARTWKSFNDDQITAVAAGVTFFGLLALFPAISAFVSLYGLVADVTAAQKQVGDLRGVFPEGAISVISDQMTRLVQTNHGRLGATFALSLAISVWSSNAGVKALISGLNVAYEEKESRNFFKLNATSLAFTVGATIFAILAVGAVVAAPGLMKAAGMGGIFKLSLLRWPILLILVVAMLSILFRFGPNRAHARWRWITPGSLTAAVMWLAMSLGFSWYVASFGNYDKTYGSLGAVVGFMTWIWLSSMVILLGAELNSELEKHTSADTTTGPEVPQGQRGAAVADGKRLNDRVE